MLHYIVLEVLSFFVRLGIPYIFNYDEDDDEIE